MDELQERKRRLILVVVAAAFLAYVLYFQGSAAADSANDTGVDVYNSTGSITGSQITSDESTWPSGDRIWDVCHAIAKAEGYNLGSGHVPYDLNNPGDISDGASQFGSQPHSGSNVTTFPDAETGWQWLYNKVSNAANGKSTVYSASMSWTQIAKSWAGNWQNWANNVSAALGVSADSTLGQYVNS